MKIIMIECTAEELEANKTIADSITEALKKMNKEEETEEESEEEE